MRVVEGQITNRSLWGILNGVFKSNPNIESMETHEDVNGASIKLILKHPVYHYSTGGFPEDINGYVGGVN